METILFVDDVRFPWLMTQFSELWKKTSLESKLKLYENLERFGCGLWIVDELKIMIERTYSGAIHSLNVSQEFGYKFDKIYLDYDLNMVGMNGLDICEWLVKHYPKTEVCLISANKIKREEMFELLDKNGFYVHSL